MGETIKTLNVGKTPNDNTGDNFLSGWQKINYNFEVVSKLFNIELQKVKETNNLEDVRENMIIINDNFKLIEERTKI